VFFKIFVSSAKICARFSFFFSLIPRILFSHYL
jgi:hypothetical protein